MWLDLVKPGSGHWSLSLYMHLLTDQLTTPLPIVKIGKRVRIVPLVRNT